MRTIGVFGLRGKPLGSAVPDLSPTIDTLRLEDFLSDIFSEPIYVSMGLYAKMTMLQRCLTVRETRIKLRFPSVRLKAQDCKQGLGLIRYSTCEVGGHS